MRSWRSNWSTAFAITKPGIFKKGANDRNQVRAIATSESITVMVNGSVMATGPMWKIATVCSGEWFIAVLRSATITKAGPPGIRSRHTAGR